MSPADQKNNIYQVEKIYANKNELLLYLRLLDTNPIIQQFLTYDSSYCLADKYLIAMVFIYFKRAHLIPQEYTYLNFFAGLCLAQSMEEDVDLSCEIYPWALGKNEVKNDLSNLLKLKSLLWQAMDYRAAVSQHCCLQLISLTQNHPIWQRERSSSYLEAYLNKTTHAMLANSEEKKYLKMIRKSVSKSVIEQS